MDSARFDALTRALSENTTRRSLTRLLGGLALGGLLHPLSSTANKRGHGKKGGKGKKGRDRPLRASAIKQPKFNPPKQSYLALGDSLAFGTQFAISAQYLAEHPCVPPGPPEGCVPPTLFDHGYVDVFGQMLHSIRPDLETINYGCPGETTDSFIGGGCFYTSQGFQLHDTFSSSQLNAAVTFLRAHHGQVSPITINLGANDLNALQGLCGNDIKCYEDKGPSFLEGVWKGGRLSVRMPP
jgi:hypothetical protein